MYSTCLFCHAGLGTNEAIEHFPVGRRLAFDAERGRLWVVCRGCGRWNLTPIEERWEAIDECERRFRDTKLRVSTEHIGMARISEGLELVRVGRPMRPEMAAWRYGDQFGRRRKRAVLRTAAVAGVGVAVIVGGPATGLLASGAGSALFNTFQMGTQLWRRRHVAVRLTTADGQRLSLSSMNASGARIVRTPDGWGVRVPHLASRAPRLPGFSPFAGLRLPTSDKTLLTGDDAVRAAALLLPRANPFGGSANEIRQAVARLEDMPRADDLFALASRTAPTSLTFGRRPPFTAGRDSGDGVALRSLPASLRLALEMAVHEDSERRALEGELAELEERWKDAEEIAAIADNLFLPRSVGEWMARHGLAGNKPSEP